MLPHSSSKLELPMNFNAIFKNVKIIKIGLLDVKLEKKILIRPGEDGEGEEDRNEKSFLEPPREFHSGR